MADHPEELKPERTFSEEQESLFTAFDQELQKTVQTLKLQKKENLIFKKQTISLQKQLAQTNSKLERISLIHQKEKQKIIQQYESQIKNLHNIQKKDPMPKILPSKKKPLKSSVQKKSQPPNSDSKSGPEQKYLSKGFKLMVLQQFIQFLGALVLTKVKFPHKMRSIKRILPLTFILLRLGVFIFVSQFRKVWAYLRKVSQKENGFLQKMDFVMKFLGVVQPQDPKKKLNEKDFENKKIIKKTIQLS